MKELKKIAIALVGFCVCFLVLDFGVGKFFDWAIKQMPSEGERVAKSEYVLNKVDADFLVIGSSRAEAHYDSNVIQEAYPEYSVFNCGVDGQLFYYINTAFNSIMDRYTPKVVVWDFQLKDLVDNTPENLSLLYPYYFQNENVKSTLDKQDPSLKFTLWNNCYRYNGTASRIMRAIRMKEKNMKGFLPHVTDKTRDLVPEHNNLSTEIVNNKLLELERTIIRAKEKGIDVILCVSPYLERFKKQYKTIEVLESLAEYYNVKFIDMSQSDRFVENKGMWYDGGHLNTEGAKVFTEQIISTIKK